MKVRLTMELGKRLVRWLGRTSGTDEKPPGTRQLAVFWRLMLLVLLGVALAHPHEGALALSLFAVMWGAQRWKNTTGRYRKGTITEKLLQQQRILLALTFGAAGGTAVLSHSSHNIACAIAVGVTLLLWMLAMEVGRSHTVDEADSSEERSLIADTASSAGFPEGAAAPSGPFFSELFFTAGAAGLLVISSLANPAWADLPSAVVSTAGQVAQHYLGLTPEKRPVDRKPTPSPTPAPTSTPTDPPVSVACPLNDVIHDLRAHGLSKSVASRIADVRAPFALGCGIEEVAELDTGSTYVVFGGSDPTIVVDDGTQAHGAIYQGVVDAVRSELRNPEADGAVAITQDDRAGKGHWLFLLTRDGSCRLLEKPDGTSKSTAYLFSEAETRWVVEHASSREAFPMVAQGSLSSRLDIDYYVGIVGAPGYLRVASERVSADASGAIGCTKALSYLQTTGQALEDSANAHN